MEVSQDRDELEQVANNSMLQQNVIAKGTQMARAGNVKKAQAIMKAYNRHDRKTEQVMRSRGVT